MRVFAGLVLVVLVGCSGPEPDDAQPASPVGLWAVPRAQQDAINAQYKDRDGPYYARPDPFYFDGETVTMKVRPFKAWQFRPPEDVFRLAARMDGDMLHVRAPWSDDYCWSVAKFEGGRFVDDWGEVRWIYELVPDGLSDPDLELLRRPRPAFDYSTPPVAPKWAGIIGPRK
jgi:hypothetical protein